MIESDSCQKVVTCKTQLSGQSLRMGEPDVEEGARLKEEGNALYREGDHAGAAALYSRGLDADPTSHLLWINRSTCRVRTLDPEGALSDADKAVSLCPEFWKTHLRKGEAHVALEQFGTKMMNTKDVRVDVKLNEFVWSQGVRGVPFRVRIRLARKRNEDQDARDKFYTVLSHVIVPTYKNLKTERIEEEE